MITASVLLSGSFKVSDARLSIPTKQKNNKNKQTKKKKKIWFFFFS
jgi:hypothetical protein